MLGPRLLLTSVLAGTIVSAGYLPEVPSAATFQYNARRQATNGSSPSFNGPYSTRGRDIVDRNGQTVSWAGVNWPMSGETMIPEGLEWASADEILSDIAGVGFNYIRMGYAIEMIDQVYDRNGEDVPLEVGLINALGYVNGTKVTKEIIAKNPGWTAQTTRFEIWSDIARIAATKGIFISPDVHTGKAQWCCSHIDGTAWFDDLHFNATHWRRGLSYVANWAKAHPNIVSMSLRNELRESWNVTDLYYNWDTLVGNMTAGADAIHEANPDLLILWGGMQYGQDLSALTSGKNILTAPCYKCTAIRDAARREPVYFNLDDHPWADKLVWELHLYSMSEDIDTGTCDIVKANFYRNGFNALGIEAPPACNITGDCPKAVRETPVILSEFGSAQDETLFNNTLQNCLKEYTIEHGVSWMMWAIAGSYRIRSGVQGFPDTWGMTNYDWSGWNYERGIEEFWKPWVKAMNTTKIV
ncbi:glycoside hydrolase family 5 protein [Bipolaris victoriae FI3]|uniref:Glycoside hydrolase family 5 protein n=2 Tax=Bipolaris TaxID=33194 RepID=W6XWU8_COCC2|nr:glycoside hydrolase family 5 protein [Bipolaris zeicola 26-R-13]XP_014559168.1 glycoside hydrolase family 5 protein [Bipolaris victoriae FI3]EUC30258.1 glycoside hydrolase family 5 protein [Bipolaris zeicola 26-R-13]